MVMPCKCTVLLYLTVQWSISTFVLIMKSDTSQDTRTRILVTAFELFSRHGYSSTSVRDIGKTIGTSAGVLTYHFARKSDLYQAAIEAPYARFVEKLEACINLEGLTPAQRLRAVIDFIAAPDEETLKLLRLLLRQLLDGIEPLSPLLPTFKQGHLRVLMQAINDAACAGQLPEGVDVSVLPIILGGAIFPTLLNSSLADNPEAQMMAKVMTGRSKDILIRLLGINA